MHAVHLGEPGECLKVWLPRSLAIGAEGFNGDIEPDFIPVLEAVGDGLLGRIDTQAYAVKDRREPLP